MGSFKFFEGYLLYQGVLYKVEGWDEDYYGDSWEGRCLEKGFPCYEAPLMISYRAAIEEIRDVLKRTNTFKNAVQAFADKKIFVYVDSTVVYDCGLEDKWDDWCCERDIKASDKVKLICRLLNIDSERENYLNGRKILVVCPEFILIQGQEKYDALFFDDVQDISLTLSDKIPVILFKDGTQMRAKVTHSSNYRPTLVRYY